MTALVLLRGLIVTAASSGGYSCGPQWHQWIAEAFTTHGRQAVLGAHCRHRDDRATWRPGGCRIQGSARGLPEHLHGSPSRAVNCTEPMHGPQTTQRRSRDHRPERRGRSGEFMPFSRTPPATRSLLDSPGMAFGGIEMVVSCQQGRWISAEGTPLIPPKLVL